ncbi:MAG: GspH/FimT family pseudopilin [Gemmatimonadota bacterium]|jgi:type II secretion system protein H|nr:GspH/FimT family pseudopilin [Gemmatimonadota bacterium]
MRNSRLLHSQGGFTLIEMMTVLVLFGIMASMAAPSLSGMVSVNKSQRALDQVSGDVAYARMLAVRTGGPVALRFNTEGYTITREVPTSTGMTLQTMKTVNLTREYPGLVLQRPQTAPADSLNFNSRGIVTNLQSDAFVATAGGRTNTLTITALGVTYRDY